MVAEPIRFRFDEAAHEYLDLATGDIFPSVTQMLTRTGHVDGADFFTDESRERGSAVHELTAAYDLGALGTEADVMADPSIGEDRGGLARGVGIRGYLLAHVKAMSIMRATVLEVEVPKVHPVLRFGGRPDRVLIAWGARAVLDGKSGAPAKYHRLQLALQAILDSTDALLPPESIVRYSLYWKKDGKFSLVEHRDRHDFDIAREIIQTCCGG